MARGSRGRGIGAGTAFFGVALCVLAALVGTLSWRLPLLGTAERALHDLRVSLLAPAEPPRADIVIVAFTEETLALTRRRSPLDRRLLAEVLDRLDAAGARAIGVDILVDQPTTPEADDALLDVLARLRTPVVLAYATTASSDGAIRPWQQAHLDALFARLEGGAVSAGGVTLSTDRDGIVRRMPVPANGVEPFARALTRLAGATPPPPRTPVRFRHGVGASGPFLQVPAHVLARLAPAQAALVARGRVALVGAILDGADVHPTPLSRTTGRPMAGLAIQAQILAQGLDGRTPREPPVVARGLAVGAFAAAGLALGWVATVPLVRLALAGALLLAPLALAGLLQLVPATADAPLPVVGAVVASACGLALGGIGARGALAEERRIVREALVRYVAPSVVARLERQPDLLAIRGERRVLAVMFTDIAGFTALSDRLSPDALTRLLNAYLDGATAIVHTHEGTLDKYVGDGLMAFWGAPLEDADGARHAVLCALALDRFAEAFQERARAEGIEFGTTRIGIDHGEVVVGNFGSRLRYQYTAVGTPVNTAARLEEANKVTQTRILVSAAAAAASGLPCRSVGRLALRGLGVVEAFAPIPQLAPQPDTTARPAAACDRGRRDVPALSWARRLGRRVGLGTGTADDGAPR